MSQHASCRGRDEVPNVTPLNVTVDRDGTRLHRLVDDVIHPVRASRAVARRDPLVEALFGAPGVRQRRK